MTFEPPVAPTLSGDERFDGLAASVLDFWSFVMSDLRTNNVRGYLAEFMVARAVGSTDPRVEWDPWDVTSPDGVKIEVKISGYPGVDSRQAHPTHLPSRTGLWMGRQKLEAGRRPSASTPTCTCSACTRPPLTARCGNRRLTGLRIG